MHIYCTVNATFRLFSDVCKSTCRGHVCTNVCSLLWAIREQKCTGTAVMIYNTYVQHHVRAIYSGSIHGDCICPLLICHSSFKTLSNWLVFLFMSEYTTSQKFNHTWICTAYLFWRSSNILLYYTIVTLCKISFVNISLHEQYLYNI